MDCSAHWWRHQQSSKIQNFLQFFLRLEAEGVWRHFIAKYIAVLADLEKCAASLKAH